MVEHCNEHQILLDLKLLRRGLRFISDPQVLPIYEFRDLLGVAIREAKQEYRGLKIRSGDISGSSSKNFTLLSMYIIMREKRAANFGTDAATLDHISAQQLRLHHIFPFDFMMKDSKAKNYQSSNELSWSEYREFLDARRRLMANAMNSLIRSLH